MNGQKNEFQEEKATALLDIFGEEKLIAFQKMIALSHDISAAMIDYKGNQVIEPLVLNSFCQEKKKEDPVCSKCLLAGAYGAMKSVVSGGTYIFCCGYGLTVIAAPIIVDNQFLGALLAGKVIADYYEYPRSEVMVSYDNGEIREERHQIPVYSHNRIQAISDLILFMIKELCENNSYQTRLKKYEHQKVHLHEMRKRNREMTRRIKMLELDNMKAELSPQLLLNMLVTISNSAIIENAFHTERLIVDLSSILRYYLSHSSSMIPVSKELDQIEKYMKSLKVSFGDNFDYFIKCQEELKEQLFPMMTLFPFAQYLVYSGLFKTRGKGMFFLDVEMIKDRFSVIMQFENPEPYRRKKPADMNAEHLSDETYMINQMQSAKKRLQYEYGDDIQIEQKTGLVVLKISVLAAPGEKGELLE